ncbi:MAG TPA: hypothetical protein VMM78_06290 [Thermomicrobiales bacterium]|nr:hypothetical protein [Thermomicrobiales bacterium]
MPCRVRTFVWIALCASLALLASGCSTVAFGSVFQDDGSATHSITVMFQRGGLVDEDARRLERQFNAALERAKADGYTAERVNTMTQTGIRVSTNTRESLDTGAVHNGLYNSLAPESSRPIAPFVGGFDSQSTAVGGARFAFEMLVDGETLYHSVQDMAPGHRQLATRGGVDEVVQFIFSATMPGDIREADGEIIGRSTVRWTLPIDGTTTMTAHSGQSKDSPWLLITLTILGSLAFVIALSASVAWVLIHQRSTGRSRIVAPTPGATRQITDSSAADATMTVQEVGTSLARVVDRVIGGQDVETAASDRAAPREMIDGTQPQGD